MLDDAGRTVGESVVRSRWDVGVTIADQKLWQVVVDDGLMEEEVVEEI